MEINIDDYISRLQEGDEIVLKILPDSSSNIRDYLHTDRNGNGRGYYVEIQRIVTPVELYKES